MPETHKGDLENTAITSRNARGSETQVWKRLAILFSAVSVCMALLLVITWQRNGNLDLRALLTAGQTGAAGQQSEEESQKVLKEILPDNYKLGVKFDRVVVDMVNAGAIDKQKFTELYEQRTPLTESQKRLLEVSSNEEIVINKDNAELLLNLLWPLGISNKTKVLSEGPMGKEFGSEVGNFASTGGWTLGKVEGGKLYNSMRLISLTPEQEDMVMEIAKNIYRPCCGNHTAFPDCNHGAAMLGFIELAVSQGMPKDEIYKKALVLNSYWFQQTYAELAIYFKKEKGIKWSKVNAKEVLSQEYSSGQGYAAINKKLQEAGLLPKLSSGGGCEV
jgi:hypothetical protein